MRALGLVLAFLASLLVQPANSRLNSACAYSLPDFTNYPPFPFLPGPYLAFMSPFNATPGTFTESLIYCPATFPNNTDITWSYPITPCASICGFLNLEYGSYDQGGGCASCVAPKQLSAINSLAVTHVTSLTGTTNGYDIIYDIFLSSTPQGATANEIEVFIHTPSFASSNCQTGTSLGTTTISGINWTVWQGGTIYCVYPTSLADVPSATIDMHAIFNYLIASGLSSSLYYNGHALGVEPRMGSGQFKINAMSTVYN